MIIPISILGIGIAILLFFYRSISQFKTAQINALEAKKKSVQDKFDFMLSHKRELRKEVEDKERELATLRNNQQGIKTISTKDLEIQEIDENEKVSRYLIQEGKLTLEQNEKVLKKMRVIQLDYLGVCLTMGYIDIDTAKKAIKINKISSKSTALN